MPGLPGAGPAILWSVFDMFLIMHIAHERPPIFVTLAERTVGDMTELLLVSEILLTEPVETLRWTSVTSTFRPAVLPGMARLGWTAGW